MFQWSPTKRVGKLLLVKTSDEAVTHGLWYMGRVASAHLERGRPARCQPGKDDAVRSLQPGPMPQSAQKAA
jgi:hypothetical protein